MQVCRIAVTKSGSIEARWRYRTVAAYMTIVIDLIACKRPVISAGVISMIDVVGRRHVFMINKSRKDEGLHLAVLK
jgi:hypothetical protein